MLYKGLSPLGRFESKMKSEYRLDFLAKVGAGELEGAQRAAKAWIMAAPADTDGWQALLEVAAERDDYVEARSALASRLHYLPSEAAADPSLFGAQYIHSDALALKIAQLWVSHQGRNRATAINLYQALEPFDWYVKPPLPEMSDEAFLARFGDRLDAFSASLGDVHDELSVWRDWVSPKFDLQRFRGEYCVSQVGSHDPSNFGPSRLVQAYTHALEYAELHDRLGALKLFSDDGLFHGLRFRIDRRIVSSDIVDSAMQLNFISKYAGMGRDRPIRLLDIGGGWGRLTHRFLQLFPGGSAHMLDVVPFNCFAAERYLAQRGVLDRTIIGGRNLLDRLKPGTIDLVANVHSWSEAPLFSIETWLDVLDRLQAPFLFFVSHGLPTYSSEPEGAPRLICSAILDHGWEIVCEQPKYGSSLQRQTWGLYPTAHYFLFRKPDRNVSA